MGKLRTFINNLDASEAFADDALEARVIPLRGQGQHIGAVTRSESGDKSEKAVVERGCPMLTGRHKLPYPQVSGRTYAKMQVRFA